MAQQVEEDKVDDTSWKIALRKRISIRDAAIKEAALVKELLDLWLPWIKISIRFSGGRHLAADSKGRIALIKTEKVYSQDNDHFQPIFNRLCSVRNGTYLDSEWHVKFLKHPYSDGLALFSLSQNNRYLVNSNTRNDKNNSNGENTDPENLYLTSDADLDSTLVVHPGEPLLLIRTPTENFQHIYAHENDTTRLVTLTHCLSDKIREPLYITQVKCKLDGARFPLLDQEISEVIKVIEYVESRIMRKL